jgi:hypothetical protein
MVVPDGAELDEYSTGRAHDAHLVSQGFTLTDMRRALARPPNRQESDHMNDHAMTTASASGTPAIYTAADIERIERSISSAPVPQRPLSTADALAALAPALRKAREKGHSLPGLVQLCVQQGLHVSERAISRAISTARTSKTTKRKQSTSTD